MKARRTKIQKAIEREREEREWERAPDPDQPGLFLSYMAARAKHERRKSELRRKFEMGEAVLHNYTEIKAVTTAL